MASIINVSIHSDISEFPTEKRYDPNIKVSELKKKLELITGANHKTMKITASLDDKQSVELSNDDETLGTFVGEKSSVKLIVKDDQVTDLLSGDVPKYTISDEKYSERENNARNFIKEMRNK